MRRSLLARGSLLGLLGALAVPAVAAADTLDAAENGALPDSVAINSLWVIVAGCLVMFMQAGFAFLEIGFSRGKNAGTVIAKILTNFSIAALMYWAVGFAFAFGVGDIIGHDGFFLRDYGDPLKAFPVMGLSDATIESKWFFQFVFCAVSLAIVWGTTLERIKFGVYIIYAIVFAGFIYPIGSHWVFGGGWLQSQPRHAGLRRLDRGPHDRRHGRARGAAAARAEARQVRQGRQAAGDPGAQHAALRARRADPVARLVRVQPGLDAERARRPLPRDPARHPAGGRGRRARRAHRPRRWKTKSIDIGMAGNGAIAALVAITAPSGYVELWTAPIIGGVAGVIVPLCIYAIDKKIDDPGGRAVGARHRRHLGHALLRPLHRAARWPSTTASATAGLIYSGSFHQLASPGAGHRRRVRVRLRRSPTATFWAIKKTYGLRVTAEEEDAGLDISEHGMYGYPEQFIPAPELVGYAVPPGGSRDIPRRAPSHQEVPAT